MSSAENLCCMCTEKVNSAINIHDSDDDNIQYLKKFHELLGDLISKEDDDTFPDCICENCCTKLKDAFKFRKQCIASLEFWKKRRLCQEELNLKSGEEEEKLENKNEVFIKTEFEMPDSDDKKFEDVCEDIKTETSSDLLDILRPDVVILESSATEPQEVQEAGKKCRKRKRDQSEVMDPLDVTDFTGNGSEEEVSASEEDSVVDLKYLKDSKLQPFLKGKEPIIYYLDLKSKIFSCKNCNLNFRSGKTLRKHSKMHDGSFEGPRKVSPSTYVLGKDFTISEASSRDFRSRKSLRADDKNAASQENKKLQKIILDDESEVETSNSILKDSFRDCGTKESLQDGKEDSGILNREKSALVAEKIPKKLENCVQKLEESFSCLNKEKSSAFLEEHRNKSISDDKNGEKNATSVVEDFRNSEYCKKVSYDTGEIEATESISGEISAEFKDSEPSGNATKSFSERESSRNLTEKKSSIRRETETSNLLLEEKSLSLVQKNLETSRIFNQNSLESCRISSQNNSESSRTANQNNLEFSRICNEDNPEFSQTFRQNNLESLQSATRNNPESSRISNQNNLESSQIFTQSILKNSTSRYLEFFSSSDDSLFSESEESDSSPEEKFSPSAEDTCTLPEKNLNLPEKISVAREKFPKRPGKKPEPRKTFRNKLNPSTSITKIKPKILRTSPKKKSLQVEDENSDLLQQIKSFLFATKNSEDSVTEELSSVKEVKSKDQVKKKYILVEDENSDENSEFLREVKSILIASKNAEVLKIGSGDKLEASTSDKFDDSETIQIVIENSDFLEEGKSSICTVKRLSEKRERKWTSVKESPRFLCSACPKSFKTKGSLTQHMKFHSEKRPHICDICGRGFVMLAGLKMHLLIHSDERNFQCTICQKTFKTPAPLKLHMDKHTKRTFQCEICQEIFPNYDAYYWHKKKSHGQKSIKCTLCDMKFYVKKQLTYHMRSHTNENAVSCPVCKRQISGKEGLKRHMRTHTGERPYQCRICDKSFKHSNNLQAHLRIHNGDPTYHFWCKRCDKGFILEHHYNRHIKKLHGEEEEEVLPD